MDTEEIKDGIVYFLINGKADDSAEYSGRTIDELREFLTFNNVNDYEDYNEGVEGLRLLLDYMISYDLIVFNDGKYDYNDSSIARIAGINEELGMRWIIPQKASEDYVEVNENNNDEEEFLLEADEKDDYKDVKKEIIYEE